MQDLDLKQQPSTPTGFASRREIMGAFTLEEADYESVRRVFPVRWPRYYLNLALENEAIARMGRPETSELLADPGDLVDPVSDLALRPHPFVVRKHADRVILLTTKKCHFYCRFCFRRDEPFETAGEPTRDDWRSIFAFLRANPEIQEPILSGGDPLTLPDEMLAWIRDNLSEIPSVTRWRIHSRAPVHHPQRITSQLMDALRGPLPLTLVTHFNHVGEITAQTESVVQLCQQAGITVKNQAVLLAGVNDGLSHQLALWRGLSQQGIAAHYLHHPDRAAGNASFRVSIGRGRQLFGALCDSGVTLPRYVLDLPDGRGKIPVMEMTQHNGNTWTFTHPGGSQSTYEDWQHWPAS